MTGEFERIARLRELFGAPPPPDLGIGDDCAVLHDPRPLVITVDAAVEGVHFDRRWITDDDLSARAVEAAVSDLAAMGALPTGLLLAWALPRESPDALVTSLARGVLRVADRLGMRVVGGNLARSPALSLTTTALGRAVGPPLRRDGARVGDALAVTGHPGAAAVGLRALMAGRGDEVLFTDFVNRWRAPSARVAEGLALVGRAACAIDLSDGLAQDAAHVAAASGCALIVDADRLPWLPRQREAAAALGHDATALALHGGEDYELLASAPAAAFDARWTIIGEVVAGTGVHLRRGATLSPVDAAGWDHFAG
jgi:thiamine-monophosphate kinase